MTNFYLTDDVNTWSQSQDHQSSLRNVLAISAVEDSEECGVRLKPGSLIAWQLLILKSSTIMFYKLLRKQCSILEESVNWTNTNCTCYSEYGCFNFPNIKVEFLAMVRFRIGKWYCYSPVLVSCRCSCFLSW